MMAVDELKYEDIDPERLSPAVVQLLESGQEKEYITIKGIYEMVKEEDMDLKQFEELFLALLGAQVTYVR
jgi:hypothetical protein